MAKTRKLTQRERKTQKFLKTIAKAETRLAKAINIQNRLQSQGKLISGLDIQKQKEYISQAREHIEAGKKYTKKFLKSMEVMKERTKVDYYTEAIRFAESIITQRGPVSYAQSVPTKVSEIEKLNRKYSRAPKQVSKEEFDRLTGYQQIMNPVSNAYAQANTGNLANALRNRTKAQRDTSFGGNSTLINDLAYSAGANPYGRNMVDMIVSLMQNGDYFTKIETLYKTTDEGKEIKKQLDQAVGADWYEEFKGAMQALIALIKMIKSKVKLTPEENAALGNLLDRYEGEAESYEKG